MPALKEFLKGFIHIKPNFFNALNKQVKTPEKKHINKGHFNKIRLHHKYHDIKGILRYIKSYKVIFIYISKFANKAKKVNYKKLPKRVYLEVKGFFHDLTPKFIVTSVKRHFPLFLAVLFLTPSAVLLGVFVISRLYKPQTQAAAFTGKIVVSKQSTTLSTDGDWLKTMAYSGDGVNGDGDYFQPIHPNSTTEGAAGTLAIGYIAMPTTSANNYDAVGAQFIPWKPASDGNLYGVILSLSQSDTAVLFNYNIIIELLRFPTASYTGTPPSVVWSNYVSCSALNTCTYPSDTVIEKRQIVRWDQTISGATAAPGTQGHHFVDFRFDPVFTATTSAHYGFRVFYNNLTTAASWPRGTSTKPLLNATNFGLGITDPDTNNAPTVTIPLANTNNMVAVNSAATVGAANSARTQNEHWTSTYSASAGTWTIAGSLTGTQTRKLTTATTGGTGASWVDDGATMTTLTANSTASTRLCVASVTGFAANQYIDLWDSDTASVQYTISSVNATDSNCSNGPSIITTAATVTGYTTNKNATVARTNWKQRIIQGAVTTLSADSTATTKLCVTDATNFSIVVGTAASIAIWDDDSAVVATRRISAITPVDAACSDTPSFTLDAAFVTGYNVANNAKVAEISANISNSGTPSDAAVFRFTSLNMSQNPTKTGTIGSLLLFYGKTIAPATSANNYPYLANLRHPFYVAYGDADTTAPVDGDMVVVGGGAADPDASDSSNLSNDLLLANISPHTLTVDKNFDMPLIYTGNVGAGVGYGTTTAYSTLGVGSGFVSMLLTTRTTLAADTTASKHYRLTVPGKVVLGSGATLQLGTSSSSYPQTSTVDIYQDSAGPAVSTTLAATLSAAATSATLTSVDGFYIGDIVQIKDDDTSPILVLIASINTATKVITFSQASTCCSWPWVISVPANFSYTAAQNATVSRGPNTERSTGSYLRSQILSARSYGARTNMTAYGQDSYRTPQANLAVDIDGNIDTGYLSTQQTVAGNTWLDVSTSSGTLAGNWSALDPVAVAQGNSAAVDNWDSSIRMGANDDANAFPAWTGTTTLGAKAEPVYNPEITEIGTIPLTNIYNADYNGGGSANFSSNYATSSAWTILNDNANTEENDAVYFGDQGATPIYALEFNIGTAISASVTRVWEYYKNGVGWTQFTPSLAWKYETRGTNNYGIGEYCVPFNANPTYPTNIIQLTDTSTLFVTGQFVKIKDNDSPTIIRRISAITAGVNSNMTFYEIIPDGYTTAQSAKICLPNGGRWTQMDASSLFTQTGKTLISWNSWDTVSPAKTTINGVSAYWVRNRISAFTSWTTSPTNQTTPVGMQGVETISSYPFNIFNSVNEAKFNHLSKGASFDPNETWVLRYNDNATASASLKTARWYESQTASYGTAHRWTSPNPDGETSAYYEKNTQDGNWRTLNGDFSWTNYSVTAKVYMNQAEDATTRNLGIFLRQDADDYGYALYIQKSTTVSQLRWHTVGQGGETAIGTATNITFNANTWYCLKAEANGTTLQGKFWSPVSEDADCEGDANEPGSWTESETNSTYSTGRFGLAADTILARFDDVTVRDTSNAVLFKDNFNDTGCWHVVGSIHGNQGCAYNSIPFTSSYINFTVKHKGGVQSGETGTNAVIGPLNAPEEGDEIYVSPLMKGSNIGLDETTGITTSDTYTKYENWDLVYSTSSAKWNVTGSQYGSAGTATGGTTYTSPGNEISLKVKSGTPTGPKFGTRAAYFQNSFERGVGNFTGLNNQTSAILIQPNWTVTGSTTQYNIEGSPGIAVQKGTLDFWFKPNFTGSPSYIQYLLDYASNAYGNRISVRLMPTGVIEAIVEPSRIGTAKLSKSFSAVAGQWYHFRLAWEDSDSGQLNQAYAFLDGSAFTTGQGGTTGARAANSGLIRLGNSWQYNAGFDGAIDEFAIFNDAVDTSEGDNWGTFTPPSSAWTNGQTAGTSLNTGTIIFLTHFDDAMEPQKGFQWADYFIGHPVMVFTNGADTLANDRIRVVTQPYRTRLWIDNTGSQYTAASRIKYSHFYRASESGWGISFQYHHRAYSGNASQPISSPVLNLRGQIRFWSDEYLPIGNDQPAINQGYGILLYNPKDIDINNIEMSQLYQGLYFAGNPYTGSSTFSTQYVRKSAFNNINSSAVFTYQKTLGSQTIDNNNFAANTNAFYGFREAGSANVTVSNNYLTGYSAASVGLISLIGGRNFTISGNKILNNYYPLYLVLDANVGGGASAVAKVTISNNEFWRFRRGIWLGGNVYLTLSGNTFDGGVSNEGTSYYGTALYTMPGTSNMEINDSNSYYGRSIWNEVDVNMPPDTSTYLAGSILSYKSENTVFTSPFHYIGLTTQDKFGGEYVATAIPGVDVRFANNKDIANYSNYGIMKTTGSGLNDTLVRTSGGYGWRLESTSKTDPLQYTAKVVGVSGKPLAVTGYLRINSTYGTSTLPAVTLSGLGMTGSALTWTAAATTDTWQQFTVSGTPTESALATLTFTVQSTPVLSDSGTAENVDDGQGINLPTIIEDTDKVWTWNQYAGYKMRDDQGFVFDIIGNTSNRLLLKGMRIPFGNTLPSQPYGNTYEIFSPPYVYLDDVSVLSGTVDTGTLDFHSQGQPVSPWLSTGLTAEGVWNAQYSSFSDSTGTFGQLLGDALVARYADVSGGSPTTTVFNTNLSSATDDFYNNGVIIFTEGNNKGVVRRISDYGGASKTVTVDPALPFVPADGDRFAVLAATATTGTTAADVWTYAIRRLSDNVLTSGDSIATVSGLTDIRSDIRGINSVTAQQIWEYGARTITGLDNPKQIWDVAAATLSTSGSIGKQVADNLDSLVSSRSTLTAAQVWENATRTITSLDNAALAAIWGYGTRELTSYGNNLSAADIWNTLLTSITMADTIGELLKTNVDTTVSSRSSQTSLDTMASNVATTSALVDTSISSRASQSSFDTHESAESAFRTSTTNTLGVMTVNIAAIQSDLSDIETKIDSIVTDLATVDTNLDSVTTKVTTIEGNIDKKSSDIYNKVVTVSDDLKTVTDRVGKVSVDSFTQLFEVKKTDIDYLKNKIIELKAVADINRQLLEKTVNQPITKVIMEWGSVIIKFVIVNPSDSVTQKIPFKAFLPKEVKQEYIMDLGGLALNYDTSTEQYYVTADINLLPGESVIRSVEIKDIWMVSEDEVNSLKKQADELSNGLKNTSYFAQSLTLKTDINTRLDKIVRKQKDNNATPQDHILAYRENMEDIKAIQENIKGLKDLVMNSGVGKNFLASIGGIQAFSTWGIVLVLIFGMGVLGSFYYSLWRKKVVTLANVKKGKKKQTIELPTPMPYEFPLANMAWAKNIFTGLKFFAKDLLLFISKVSAPVIGIIIIILNKVSALPKALRVLMIITVIVIGVTAGGLIIAGKNSKKLSNNSGSVEGAVSVSTPTPMFTSAPNQEVIEEIGAKLREVHNRLKQNEQQLTPAPSPIPTLAVIPSVAPTATPQKTAEYVRVVNPDSTVNVRETPETSSKIILKIKAGIEYLYLDKQNGWYQIELSDGRKGWVKMEFVEKVIKSGEAVEKTVLGATTNAVSNNKKSLVVKQTPTDWLNVRAAPSKNGKIITKIYPGESYPFSEVISGWYKISLKNNTEGWVSSEYIRIAK